MFLTGRFPGILLDVSIPPPQVILIEQCEEASASLHKYDNVCGERDGVEFAKRRRDDKSDLP